MEQTRQQISEMLAVRVAVINRGELEEADAYHAKLEALWARLLKERTPDHYNIMTKLKDKIDDDKKKLTVIFEAKTEDNCETFESTRDTLVSRRDGHQEATKARIETGQEQSNTELETDL
jgi:hypothetical protein